ncbi:hypothetical protein FO519_003485 [Halicephalobus sp. NKZ332]|nr:hypothetical protein FO519_003485 [Halicephalobus sp. NKZ332]
MVFEAYFKSALQGVVQRMATPENIQSTFQYVQGRFVKEVPRSEAKSRISEANYEDFTRKISESRFPHFPVYLSRDGNYKVVYEEVRKQVFSTAVQDEAFLLAGILEKSPELAFEAYNFEKLDALIETILSHQTWSEFHLACSVGCPSFISSFLGKIGSEEKTKIVISTPTNDTGDFPLHLGVQNENLEVVSLLLILGSDPKSRNKKGRSSFHLAAMKGITVLKKLIEERNSKEWILDKDTEGKNPLILAGEKGNAETVRFISKLMDYEIYNRMVREGNRPLHCPGSGPWRKLTAEIILEEHPEFIEVPDSEGETPLMKNVKSGDLEMVLVLIAHGADVYQEDKEGKNALIYAIQKEEIYLIKLFLALGTDYKNEKFKTELSKLKSNVRNQVLDLLGKIQQEEKQKTKKILDLTQERIFLEAMKSKKRKLRLLSLDGGGIRGLVSILLLVAVESRLRKKLNKKDAKLIDFFDWVAGTSTGAIIGLSLISGKSTMDVLRLYLRFRDRVFEGKRPYATKKLEAVLQKEFGPETKMSEIAPGRNKRIFVTTTNAKTIPPELVLLRNYENCEEEPSSGVRENKDVKVWLAARCSSAAPTYFEAVDSKYLDGGLMANNPCSDLIVEVTKYSEYLRAKNGNTPEIGCVVSIGTGKCPPRETKVTSINMPTGFADILQNGISSISGIMSLSKMFIDQICSSDGPIAERAQVLSYANGAPFFRFTPNLEMEVDLDSADDLTVIDLLWAARCHAEKTANHEINDLVDLLTIET